MGDDGATKEVARVPRGLAGMLAIVAAVEIALGSCDVATTTHLIDSWTHARAMSASGAVRESAILCFGDSQIKQGLQPAVLADRLGEPAYNLAVHGGQPAAAYALLSRALDAGARPKAVIVGFFPGLLGSDLRINDRQWPEILGPAAAVDLGFTARSVDLVTTTLLGVALRSYRSRTQLRSAVGFALRGEANPAAARIVADRGQAHARRGALALPANPTFADEEGPTVSATPGALAWKPRSENERSIQRLLDLTRQRGIAVYWVTTTLSPSAQATRKRAGLHEGYIRYLLRLQAEYPDLTVLDTLGLGFDRGDFYDPCHLEGRAATRLSEAVAEAIAAADPSRRRWVRLSPSATSSGDAQVARRDVAPPAR